MCALIFSHGRIKKNIFSISWYNDHCVLNLMKCNIKNFFIHIISHASHVGWTHVFIAEL